jgi:RNA polymerase sigma-70 factor (ECF subfamily)
MEHLPIEKLAQLVMQAIQGDEKALAELVQHTKKPLFRFCFYLVGDPHQAEDICQETFVRALTRLKKLKDPKAFRPWLFTIAKNLFYDSIRKQQPILNNEMTANQVDSSNPELTITLQKTLALLKPDERMVILLVDLEGYAYEEAAGILGISTAAVRSRLHKARIFSR